MSTIYHGDCREVMSELDDNSIDSIVTDPPYELAFMGKKWDSSGIAFDAEVWAQAYRVLKPGGHLLAFGGTRTFHRLAVAIEDAGFEIRDSIAWLYGTGFPKSLNVSKAIDKAAGSEREVVGPGRWNHVKGDNANQSGVLIRPGGKHVETAPATPDAKKWEGWGTAMKPAFEPIIVARKPLSEKTVAKNVLKHGTGALNIDANRIPTDDNRQRSTQGIQGVTKFVPSSSPDHPSGRYPANVILDESQAEVLDEQSGERPGGASRFFYVAKAPAKERPEVNGIRHTTVKPLTLIRTLIRLVTPPGGVVLDPFAGSGTSGEAAVLEGFDSILIENEADYLPLIQQRINRAVQNLKDIT